LADKGEVSAENGNTEKCFIGAAPGFVKVKPLLPSRGLLIRCGAMGDFTFFILGEEIFFCIPDEAVKIFFIGGPDDAAWHFIDHNNRWQHKFWSPIAYLSFYFIAFTKAVKSFDYPAMT
jgi:hypothetical protein